MKVGELFLALGLAVQDKDFNVAEESIKRLQRQLQNLAMKALLARTNTEKAMKTIGLSSPAQAAKKTLADLVGTGNKVTGVFGKMAAAAAGFFAVSKIKDSVLGVVELGSVLNDTSQKSGLSTDALQEFGFAAIQNSSSAENMADGVKKLSRGLIEAKKAGTGPAVDGLKALGIAMNDPAVKSKNLEQLLYLVAAKFETMPDGAEKTAAAMNLFGKSGADLIPTLNLGVQGLAELRKKAHDVGYVMSGETVRGLDTFGDKLDESKATLEALKNQAVAALLPLLTQMLDKFQAWVVLNGELIRTSIADGLNTLVEALKLFATVISFAVKHWKALAIVMGGVTFIKALISITRLVLLLQSTLTAAGIQAAISWAAILGPIALIAAAILALGYLIYRFRDKIKDALRAVGRFFGNLWDSIKQFGKDIESFFAGIGEAIVQAFKEALDWVVNKVHEVGSAIRNAPGIKRVIDFVAGEEPTAPSFSGIGSQTAFATAGLQGATGAASLVAPTRSISSGGTSPSLQQNTAYNLTINAKNADANEVSRLVQQRIREHDEQSRRQTAAALGVE